MKQITNKILFMSISLFVLSSAPAQGAAYGAAAALKSVMQGAKTAAPLVGETAPVIGNAIKTTTPSLLKMCGQKMGEVAMKHVIRPAYVLGRAITVTTLGALGVYGGGKVIMEQNGYIPAPVPAAPVPAPAVKGQGLFGGVFKYWGAPAGAAAPAAAKTAEGWWAWIPGGTTYIQPGINYILKKAAAYPTGSKIALGYFAAGYAYIHIVKRLQLTTVHRKFLAGIQAAQNGQTGSQTWIDCQNTLQANGFGANATMVHAVNYLKDLKASDIDNGWLDWAFFPHVLLSRQLRNDKILWLF
jgi:hypothetical protein